MFKSFINPQKIIGNETKATTPEAFSNFMSGGKAAVGSSVSTGAANNISNFSRGNVSVEGSSSNLAPLISNISTSIVNNVDNSISNTLNTFKTEIQSAISGLQKQAQSNLSAVIQNFSKDYQQRIQNKEDNKPSNILKGFLGLYQNAINFVTFFGDSKNNKKIEISLKSLRKMFDESFNTAMVIRQTINKIVKQLSNLPTASGSSGGLNLDVNVPGGPLKQSGRATLSKFAGSRGGKLFGAGVVGAGALGIMGMQSAKASQEEKLAASAKKGVDGEDKSNDFMKGLNDIIERFSDSINSLLGIKKDTSGGGGGGASSSGGGATPDGGGAPGGGGVPAGPSKDLVTGAQGFMDMGFTKKGAAYLSGNVQQESGWKGQRKPWVLDDGAGTNKGLVSWNRGRIASAEKFLGKPLDKATNEEQMKSIKHELETIPAYSEANKIFKDSNASEADLERASKIYLGYGDVGSRYSYAQSALKGLDGYVPGSRGVAGTDGKSGVAKKPPTTTKVSADPSKPGVAAAQTQAQVTAAPTSKIEPAPPTPEAQKVSQAIKESPGQDSNNKVEVASLAPDITVIPGGGSQDGGAVASLPSPSMDTSDVSMYGSTADMNNPYWSLPYTFGIVNV